MEGAKTPNHDGLVSLEHDGETISLAVTWSVISQLQKTYGLEEWDAFVRTGLEQADINALAEFMALCAGVDIERGRALCVPLYPARAALIDAWQVGMTGNIPPDDDAGKPMALMMSLGRLFTQPFKRESDGPSSGH